MCSISIFVPIMISMRPPAISILFSKRCPSLLPAKAPKKDNTKVIVPMMIIGVAMSILRIAKLRPTAKASMLVAIDRSNNTLGFNGLVSFSTASIFVASYIILQPIKAKSVKAIQWSTPEM